MEGRSMKQRLAQLGIILLFLICCNLPLAAQAEDHQFSISGIHLQEGERVVGIDVSLQAGSFVTISGIPSGWLVIVDNDASWQTSLKGDAKIGSAALDATNMQKMNILVRRFEFGDLKFNLSGALLVTKNFEVVRKIPLGRENFKEISVSISRRWSPK
jgi:hypothetical protein